jgi:hypothetical protein
MKVRLAFVFLEVGLKVECARNLAASVPNTPGCPPGDVPELAGSETKRVEVVTHLREVADTCTVGARDRRNRRT